MQTTLTMRRFAGIVSEMTQDGKALVRAFDGSLSDAKGLLAVERATFDESPYSAPEVQRLLSKGAQHAWVAVANDEIIGFVVAFATEGLSGPCWEVDLLAVHPRWQGQGLATDLIRAAAGGSPASASRARAVVATDNDASMHAFSRAGFQPAADTCSLLIHRPADAARRPPLGGPVQVHEAADTAEAARWLAKFHERIPGAVANPLGRPGAKVAPTAASRRPHLSLLLASDREQPAGYAELLGVQTLLYRGAWMESLVAPARATREALVDHALRLGIEAGWDEIGSMVPNEHWPFRNALLAQGFHSLGDFRWLIADLPLAAGTPPRRPGSVEGTVAESRHV
jgi:ribosomal protein S18 acetylase RimI-like enzyme